MTYVIFLLMVMKRVQIEAKFTSICIAMAMIGLLVVAPIRPVAADDPPNLKITNLSGTILNLSYTQLLEMHKTVVNADLYCNGALLTYGNWGGVLLSQLLTQAQVTPEVSSIQFVATDGYGVAIPTDLAMQPQLIIAYEKDGTPLTGGLRLIVPGANGAVWISGIVSIAMSTNGADYPQGISVGSGTLANISPAQNNTTPELPSEQQPLQPQSSKSDNSSNIQVTSHPNDTDLYQPPEKTQSPNGSMNFQTELMYLTGFAATMLVVTALVAYGRKKKRSLDKSLNAVINIACAVRYS